MVMIGNKSAFGAAHCAASSLQLVQCCALPGSVKAAAITGQVTHDSPSGAAR